MNSGAFTSEVYWSQRYRDNNIPWDAGSATTPIKAYLDSLVDREIKVLIPGAGSGWEAEYARKAGFDQVYVLDISKLALDRLAERCGNFPPSSLLHEDFFAHKGTYDLVIEQTFFCALPPSWRSRYVEKMREIIRPGGILAGVLFDDPLNTDHPPFGGNEEEYRTYFFPAFTEKHMERCYNSIPPRQGRELFIELIRPFD